MKFQKWKNHDIGLEIGSITLKSPERLFKNLSEANARNSREQIQIISLSPIVSEKHLFLAGIQALNSFESNSNYSNSLAYEILLRASATRQMESAIKRLELKPGKNDVGILAIGSRKEIEKNVKNFLLQNKSEIQFKKSSFPELNSKKIETIIATFDLEKETSPKKLSLKKLEDIMFERMALNGVEN